MLEIAKWRGDRAVEGARLEIVCTPNKGTEGSNPSLSATALEFRVPSSGFKVSVHHASRCINLHIASGRQKTFYLVDSSIG